MADTAFLKIHVVGIVFVVNLEEIEQWVVLLPNLENDFCLTASLDDVAHCLFDHLMQTQTRRRNHSWRHMKGRYKLLLRLGLHLETRSDPTRPSPSTTRGIVHVGRENRRHTKASSGVSTHRDRGDFFGRWVCRGGRRLFFNFHNGGRVFLPFEVVDVTLTLNNRLANLIFSISAIWEVLFEILGSRQHRTDVKPVNLYRLLTIPRSEVCPTVHTESHFVVPEDPCLVARD
mmetsp:Transcript_18695/g.29783  ORF Transcript_18695/g.29783 Transcript_18695/m.29783 type:complete len:231 (-) Transcript_18695:248-940(-)